MEKDIRKYEAMAKLNFDGEESRWALSAFERILSGFEKLNDISTYDVEPLVYLSDNTNALREDNAVAGDIGEYFVQNAPDLHNGYIRVPKTVE